MRAAALALAAMSACGGLLVPCGAALAEDRARRPWYLPDQAKLQLAGAIGFLSPGAGYALLDRRVELDLFLGYAPESLAGVELWSLTGKVTWFPWRVGLGRGWSARPLSVAAQLTYTLGDRFFVVLPERYGPEYYPLPTALRAGLALGTAIGRPVGRLEHLGAYAEVVGVDLPLGYLVSNLGTVRASEVLSVALGVRLEL
jgi:hypothetical protein